MYGIGRRPIFLKKKGDLVKSYRLEEGGKGGLIKKTRLFE